MDSLYIGSLRVSQFLSILLIIFAVVFIFASYFLHKKGKIKSLAELKPFYEKNLASLGKENSDNNSQANMDNNTDSQNNDKNSQNKKE